MRINYGSPLLKNKYLTVLENFGIRRDYIKKEAKKLNTGFTHIAFNFMTEKNIFEVEDDFEKGLVLQNSREMLPAEELT